MQTEREERSLSGIAAPSRKVDGNQGNQCSCFSDSGSLSQHTNVCFRYLPLIHNFQRHETSDAAGEWKSWLKLIHFSVNKESFAAGKALRVLKNTESFEYKKVVCCLHGPFKS